MPRVVLVLIILFALLIGISFMRSRAPAPVEPDPSGDEIIDIPRYHLYGGADFGRQIDISPDGKRIVYSGQAPKGNRRLYVQTIGEKEPAEIPETVVGNRDIRDPTFSPDGRFVAYWGQGMVKKTTIDGTEVAVIGKFPSTRGIAWLDNNTLVGGNVQ